MMAVVFVRRVDDEGAGMKTTEEVKGHGRFVAGGSVKAAARMACVGFSLLMAAVAVADELVVTPRQGERWWGGATIFGRDQPYGDFAEKDQNLDCFNNQISPFFVSSCGRYVWSDKPVKWSAKAGALTVSSAAKIALVEAGGTLREAFLAAAKRHFPSTGTLPDELFFTRPQYNHYIESYYTGMTQSGVEAYAADICRTGFPMGVVMIDGGWSKDIGVWDFDRTKFPKPEEMVAKLHALGARVMVWLVPYVSGDCGEGARLAHRRIILEQPEEAITNPDEGRAAIVKWWTGYSLGYDLSVPETHTYLSGVLNGLCKKYGIDGFKFDGADLWHYTLATPTGVRFRKDGYTAADNCRDWSLFATNWAFNEMRASYNTAGQPLVQRLQDKNHSWEDLRQVVPDMLAAGILGYAYTCGDMIGGGCVGSFLNPKFAFDSALFVRSCQAQALMPMMQFSLAPWRVLTAEELAICREAAHLHVAFAPYILSLARHAAQTGEPIVRLMEYVFPHQGLETCSDQFMLGERWLVAPILTKDAVRAVRLPKGTWRDDLGVSHEGPKTLMLRDVPLARLPRYERLRAE